MPKQKTKARKGGARKPKAAEYSAGPISLRDGIILTACFAYLAGANLIWIAHDTRPPFWDMASHQHWALQIYDAVTNSGLAGISVTVAPDRFYPPLYHSILAVFYALFGTTFHAARYANLGAIAILLVATYAIGRRILPPLGAVAAAALVSFYPYMLWLSRETLIDYWLSAMVALSIWLLLKTDGFSRQWWSIAFGVSCGLGMLTKYTFPFFVGFPFLWAARHNIKNAIKSLLVAGVLSAGWYIPSLHTLSEQLKLNAAGARTEGDPSLLSWQAVMFYWRALEGYQLFLPLFALFLVGAALVIRKIDGSWAPVLLWLAGGWMGLMLFQNKDPRYSAPFLPAVALITAKAIGQRKPLLAALAVLLLFQHYLVSFGVPQIPERIVLAKGIDGPLSWDWNLYTQTYFQLWGPPKHEDWKINHLLDVISPSDEKIVRLGMVPDIPRFDLSSIQLQIALRRTAVTVRQLYTVDESLIADHDYLLTSKTGTNRYSAPYTRTVSEYVEAHTDRFHFLESITLPNGEIVHLYRVNR